MYIYIRQFVQKAADVKKGMSGKDKDISSTTMKPSTWQQAIRKDLLRASQEVTGTYSPQI